MIDLWAGRADRGLNGPIDRIWPFRSHGDADLLCAGKPKPLVRSGVRRRLRFGLHLRLHARRMAFRGGQSDLGCRCRLALADAISREV
jgi:hypothetical protein